MKIEFKTVTYQFTVEHEYFTVRFFRNGPALYTVQVIYQNSVIYLGQHVFRVTAQKIARLFLLNALKKNPNKTPINA
ncbi:MAG: hypothetical protein JWQ09_5847 [Segetibacter sp.]|nr:hypothetical protein [Segetibacter sp.]